MESLLRQGIDVFHLCDAEFNLPPDHARNVCDELIRRGLGSRCRWYAYLAVVPFDADLARRMAQAGCVGINFTSDSASAAMLSVYGQPHRQEDLLAAIRHCRQHGIAVMCDLLLGGPGETVETVTESIRFFQHAGPDCVGTALGLRLYPRTRITAVVAREGPLETNPSIRRHYDGAVDLLRPTFYISAALGDRPARLVRDLIAGDQRFFEPEEETSPAQSTGRTWRPQLQRQPGPSRCDTRRCPRGVLGHFAETTWGWSSGCSLTVRWSPVFHRADCKSAAKITEKNLVRYNTREEAIQAGKSLAGSAGRKKGGRQPHVAEALRHDDAAAAPALPLVWIDHGADEDWGPMCYPPMNAVRETVFSSRQKSNETTIN